jgi:flagellar hook-basal body complex protein FliE
MQIPAAAVRAYSIATPGIAPTPTALTGTAPAANAGGSFGQALTNAISSLSDSQDAADDASVRMAAGDPIDLHEVMLVRETASLHFQLAVQVRNKLVEAYQDVMRMQV